MSHPLSSLPALDSYPGTFVKVFLDFDGDSASGIPAYDIDGDASTYSDQELANIAEIWARVAEKFAPFKINVTTVDPGNENRRETWRVIIGGAGPGGTYGATSIGDFANNNGSNNDNVYSAAFSGDPKTAAEVAAHETGHAFGLRHKPQYSGATVVDPYDHGSGGIAPIMGNSYASTRGVWVNQASDIDSTTFQDELDIISGVFNQIFYKDRTNGGTAGTASALSIVSNAFSTTGIIIQTSDRDYYSFTTGAGSVTINARPGHFVRQYGAQANGVMLQPKLELRDSSDVLITSSDNTASLNQTITTTLAAGSYYVVVTSHGSYWDVGTYDLDGTLPAPAVGGGFLKSVRSARGKALLRM